MLGINFITDLQNKDFPVLHNIIRTKAQELAATAGIANFKASSGWCIKMKKYLSNSLSQPTTLFQHLPA